METLTQPEDVADEPPSGEHPALTDDEYALLFPGQGSQSVGMAGKVLQVYPNAEQWFTRANDVLEYDLLHLIEHGPNERTEPDHALAAGDFRGLGSRGWRHCGANGERAGRTLSPKVVSGHSMGQITAMLAARAVDFDDAAAGWSASAPRSCTRQTACDRAEMASIIGPARPCAASTGG